MSNQHLKETLGKILEESANSATLKRKEEAKKLGLIDPKEDYDLTTSKDVENEATWYRSGIRSMCRQIRIEKTLGRNTKQLEQMLERERAEFKQFKAFWNL